MRTPASNARAALPSATTFNPRAIAASVDPTAVGKRFCALNATQMSRAQLKAIFAPTLLPMPATCARTQPRTRQTTAPCPSAVLIGLQMQHGQWHVILTVRSTQLQKHSGQIALPGGKIDAADSNAIEAAIREAQEEIALPRAQLQVIGTLAPEITGTGFEITPVVALVEGTFTPKLSEGEVSELFTVPLSYLLDPAHHTYHQHTWEDTHGTHTRTWYSMRYLETQTQERFIWGVTARVLRNFYLYLFESAPQWRVPHAA